MIVAPTVVRVHDLDLLEPIVTVKGDGVESDVPVDCLGLARPGELATLLVGFDPGPRFLGRNANLQCIS